MPCTFKFCLGKADIGISAAVRCYMCLDVPTLSSILDELQTVLCESVSLANKPLQRKLANLQADPKADAEVLNELEGVSKQVNGEKKHASCLES